VYLEPKERVWWLQISFCPSLPLRGANSALLNPLAGFEGPLHGEGKKGKGKEGKDVKDGRKCLPEFVYTVSGKKCFL